MIPRILGAALALALFTLPALAQNLPPSGLPARGAVVGTDIIVDQPAGSSTVQGAQASALLAYVQTNFAAAGTSGQVQINSGGAFAGVTVSGDGTLSSSGALTVTKSNGAAFGSFAFQNYTGLPSASGSPPIAAGTVFPCIPTSALDGCTGAQLLTYVTGGPIGADPTGAADSTSALQTWLNAGSPGTIPCGIYKTTATLTMETAANNGQQVRGSGAGSGAGAGACRTVIKPTSAVATALVIDGTPIGGWIMGMGFHDIVFDMTNMTDASTTSAINQIQAYDVSYERVRVINDGASKRGWLFSTGAFTTTLLNTQANIIDFEGTSAGNAVTTVTLVNADVGRLVGNYAQQITLVGGAVQPAYNSGMSVIYLAGGAAATPPAISTGCASGCYLIIADSMTNSDSLTFTGTDIETLGSYPSTYNDGTHGSLSAFPVFEVPSTLTRATFSPSHLAGMYIYDLSASAVALGNNLGGGSPYNLFDAPTTFAGGLTIPSGQTLTLGSAQTWPGLSVKPASDGTTVNFENAAGSSVFNCYTYGTGGCQFYNQSGLYGFYDNGSTTGWSITMPSAGNGLLKLYSTGNTATITLTGANGNIQGGSIYGTPVGLYSPSSVNATSYAINGTAGVSCSGTPTSSFATVDGIVTHC